MWWRSRDAICRALSRKWEAEGLALGRENEASVRRAFGALGVVPSGDYRVKPMSRRTGTVTVDYFSESQSNAVRDPLFRFLRAMLEDPDSVLY